MAKLYEPKHEAWKALRVANPSLSIPMWLKTSLAYFESRIRVVFVGQETHGWWTNCEIKDEDLNVDQVMYFYDCAALNEFRIRAKAPYWRAVKKITSSLNLSNFPQAILTSNLFPSDSNKGQSPKELLETMRSWKVLPEELKILDPHFVVFFVGPNYAYNLEYYFGQKAVSSLSYKNPLLDYSPAGWSWRGFFTYHPASLSRSRNGAVLDEISRRIQDG